MCVHGMVGREVFQKPHRVNPERRTLIRTQDRIGTYKRAPDSRCYTPRLTLPVDAFTGDKTRKKRRRKEIKEERGFNVTVFS